MKQINIKRLRLILSIVGIGLSFFLIIWFAHNPLFEVYYAAKIEKIPDIYRLEITELIIEIESIETNIKENVRKKLWDMMESPDFSREKKYSPEIMAEIREISEYTKMIYIIVGFIIMIVSVTLTIWYKSGIQNLLIAAEKKVKKTQ